MMLLDWSGSMSDCLKSTVNQLINLVEFVRRVNIPFEVYFFTSERKYSLMKLVMISHLSTKMVIGYLKTLV